MLKKLRQLKQRWFGLPLKFDFSPQSEFVSVTCDGLIEEEALFEAIIECIDLYFTEDFGGSDTWQCMPSVVHADNKTFALVRHPGFHCGAA